MPQLQFWNRFYRKPGPQQVAGTESGPEALLARVVEAAATAVASAAAAATYAAAAAAASSFAYATQGLGAVVRSVADRAHDNGVHVADFMTIAELADVASGALTLDVSDAVQRAIDYAIYRNSAGRRYNAKVVFHGGDYRLDKTIHVGYGTTFTSVLVEGAGPGTTLFWPTHNDQPGISIQGARGTTIRGIGIYGLNRSYIYGFMNNPQMQHLDPANWVNPVLPESATSRYAPYVGIAIDGYSGVRPATSYPDVTYPAFMGAVSQYGKGISSRVWIDDCIIQGFVVGVTNQCSDIDGNGDFTKLSRTEIGACVYGLSIGNSQARLTSFSNGGSHRCHTFLLTGIHGRQQGMPEVRIVDSEIRLGMYWLNCPQTGYGQGPHFVDCYGEAMYALGTVGGAGAQDQYPTRFDHCQFSFSLWENHIGAPVYVMRNEGSGHVIFNSCSWDSQDVEVRIAFYGQRGASSYIIRENHFDTSIAAEQWARYAVNATCGFTFNELSTNLADFSCRTTAQYDLDTGLADRSGLFGSHSEGPRNRLLPVYCKTALANPNDPGFGMPHPVYSLGKSGKTITTDGLDVTVDLGAGWFDVWFQNRGGDVGDVVWDSETGVTFYVRSRTGKVITMRAQNGFDGAFQLLTPITTAGSLYFLNTRRYTPQYVTYTATSSSSPIATGAQRDDGFKAFLSTEIAVGDAFWVDPTVDHFLTEGNAQIAAVDANAGTITASGNFRRTETRTRLKLFVRAPAPNA